MNDKFKNFYGITVGQINSGKFISIPSDLETAAKYIKFIFTNFNSIEIFVVCAIFEYLVIGELKKYGPESIPFQISQSLSSKTREFLNRDNRFETVMKQKNLKNSIDILKLGETLVFSEFKWI